MCTINDYTQEIRVQSVDTRKHSSHLFRGPRCLASDAQILKSACLEFVHQAMDPHIISIRPSVLDSVREDDILDLNLHRLPDLIYT